MCKQTLLIFMLLSLAYGQDRKIISKLNPGCNECSTNTVLVYIKCEGNEDTIHQIWDFTQHTPTVIFAIGSTNSTVNITWHKTSLDSFNFSEKPKYSFAAVIDKLYEYNDIDDNGHIEPQFPQREQRFENVVWSLERSKLTEREVMVQVSGVIRGHHHRNGTVRIKLDLIPFVDYAVNLPHLIHTANSTLIDVSLVNLTTSPDYNSSRYAVHMTLVSTDHVTTNMHYTMRMSLDDEHTPGIFEIIEIKTPALYMYGMGGYLQFRPVAYRETERNVASSTIAHVSNFSRTVLPRRSTVQLFYDDAHFSNVLVQDLYISFGENGDGFYKNHNFTDWSFTIGYGSPPVEGFSMFVTLVISLGLGLPVILAITGLITLALRRPRDRQRLH